MQIFQKRRLDAATLTFTKANYFPQANRLPEVNALLYSFTQLERLLSDSPSLLFSGFTGNNKLPRACERDQTGNEAWAAGNSKQSFTIKSFTHDTRLLYCFLVQ